MTASDWETFDVTRIPGVWTEAYRAFHKGDGRVFVLGSAVADGEVAPVPNSSLMTFCRAWGAAVVTQGPACSCELVADDDGLVMRPLPCRSMEELLALVHDPRDVFITVPLECAAGDAGKAWDAVYRWPVYFSRRCR